MENKKHITAIVLAGGSGTRMGAVQKKQYLLIGGRPILYYSLQTFEESSVDDIILVSGEVEFCQREIIEKYKLKKVVRIVPPGDERYHSVYHGLVAASEADYVLIHDGARPFLTNDIIERSISAVIQYDACAVGMPVKDTIKISDEDGFIKSTPVRNRVWSIQTPQSFSYAKICAAYDNMMEVNADNITDDAMVMESFGGTKVKLIEGSYQNIKITTPEDMEIAQIWLRCQNSQPN
ncbi:MAG: 2-C-methyl-D-erythritol 4-phosphate cytidylyltransferase [Lachnospiraceae bacterium]